MLDSVQQPSEGRGMRFQQQAIVITGASSGFGAEIARRCAAQGATVVLAARSVGPLRELAAELNGGPGNALAISADVSDTDSVQALVAQTLERCGRVDVLVNNAGFGILDTVQRASLADMQRMMDVNFFGAVRCTGAFLPHLLASPRPHLVMMASYAGLLSVGNFAGYAATKHALVGYTRSLMIDTASTRLRCALICPGVAMTNFMQQADFSRFPRITSWTSCTAEQVARRTVRAIAHREHGEIMVPRHGALFRAAIGLFPDTVRHALIRLG